MISGLICAAGQGKRLDTAKPLLVHDNSTMLSIVLDQYRASDLDELIVVLGFAARKVVGEIDIRRLKTVINSRPSQGLSSSIQRGWAYLRPGSRAVLIGMGDMPLVKTKTINKLIKTFHKSRKGIVVPTHKGQRGHPVVIDAKYQDAVLALRGDVGCKSILADNEDDIEEIPFNSDEVIVDVDTYQDWLNVRQRLNLTESSDGE